MCKKTKDGYKLESGRLIKYENIDFASLTPDEFKELAEEKASFIEIITMKQDINKILFGIDELKTTYDKIANELKLHTNNCPIQKTEVNRMIDNKILNFQNDNAELVRKNIENVYWENLKEKIVSGSKLLKAILFFLIVIFSFGIFNGLIDGVENLMKILK